MGLSDADFAVFRDTAVRLRDELKEISERAEEILQTRRALARAAAANRTRLPPSPELIELREQCDAVLVDEIAAMRTKLGLERTAGIDAFISRLHRRSQKGQVQLTPEQLQELPTARPHAKGDQ